MPFNAAQVVDSEHPWLGLSPFTEATRNYFFGRDQEIRDIFLRVKDQPLTILYGQSGLGKTSLLGAGLVPKLRIEQFSPVQVRLRYESTDPPLAIQLFQAIEGARLRSDQAHSTGMHGPATLWEAFHHLPSRQAEFVEHPPVLIFDQFEEIFTLTLNPQRQREAEELFCQLADFIENRPPARVQERLLADRKLARDYDQTTSTARIVITLREDYLSQLEAWKKVMPALMRNRMALHLLNGPQALEAVVRPGCLGKKQLVSPEVGHRIVCFVARRPMGTPLEEIGAVPPLLSLLCHELNEVRLTQREAEITGAQFDWQSEHILQKFYIRSFDGLAESVRRFVEDRMVTVGGHRNPVAREDALAELLAGGVPEPAQAIDQLVKGRLLTAEERGGVQRLEITHDVLAPLAMRSRDERKAREASELAERVTREERRLRRNRAVNVVHVTLTLVALAASGWAWHAQGIATTEKKLAEKRAEYAATQRAIAERISKEAETQRKVAVEQRMIAEQQRIEADKQRLIAVALEKEARLQKRIADKKQAEAEESAVNEKKAREAEAEQKRAVEQARDEAIKQRENAERLSQIAKASQKTDQTFEMFRSSQPPPQKFTKMSRIDMQPVGRLENPALLQDIQEFLSNYYGIETNVLPAREILLAMKDQREHRGSTQWLAEAVIDGAVIGTPITNAGELTSSTFTLLITEHDLWSGSLNYVFAINNVRQRVGIFSLNRLKSNGPANDILLLRRALKLANFATSQAVGIRDFSPLRCCMNPTNTLDELDHSPLAFCTECEQKVWWLTEVDPPNPAARANRAKRYQTLIRFADSHNLVEERKDWENALASPNWRKFP